MYKLSVIVFCMFICSAATGQLKQANSEYANMHYYEAIPLFEQCIVKGKRVAEARVKLADCYRKIKDYKNAVRLYAELAHLDNATAEDMWLYASALASTGQYTQAAEYYKKYHDMNPQDDQSRAFMKQYEHIETLYKDSANLRVAPVISINSWQADFSPIFYGKNILFVSNRFQENVVRRVFEYDESAFLDYYIADDTSAIHTDLMTIHSTYIVNKEKDVNTDETPKTANDSDTSGSYGETFLHDSIRYMNPMTTKVRRLQGGNKKWHEGPATFFKEQDRVIFSRNIKRSDGVSRQALYMATVTGEKWNEPILLQFNVDNASSAHPALSPDNKVMYFASDRPGGVGGTDLYRVSYDNGVWGTPENVAEVNTVHNEAFPYVAEDGTLYFSSDGRPGLGGMDIFMASVSNGAIASVVNMGTPVNSMTDDFGIILNPGSRTGFFSSNRKRGFSDDDIYSLTRTCDQVSILVVAADTKKPIPSAQVTVDDQKITADENGRAVVCLRPGSHDYAAEMNLYEGKSLASRENLINFELLPVTVGIEGTVTSEQDKAPMDGVRVRLLDSTGKQIGETVTGANGKYKFPMTVDQKYKIVADKMNCGTNTIEKTTVGLKKSQTLDGNFSMICVGDIIRVENIYYDLNKSNIRTDAAVELDKLADVMWKYPDMRIELRSHTDSRSSAASNMKLSTARANSVVEYLAGKGIVNSRMRAAGYGESIPVNKCVDGVKCTEEEYQQNRRTEFKVLSIK